MKAYIIYIATLLAALALPASGQTGSTDTKAAPDKPAMPYKLSLVTTGGNNGTVAVADSAGSNGMTVVGKDTLIYAASGGNATTVKLTVTPNAGYIVRKDYPKAYKTGDTGTTVTVNGTSTPYTFRMPASPVTVEIAYAHQLEKIGDITLKESKQTAEEVITILPKYVSAILAGGRKDSLEVSNWSYATTDNDGQNGAHDNGNTGNNGAYNAADGAVNVFTFTLAAALPDSLDANGKLSESGGNGDQYTGKCKVANMAQPFVPEEADKDKGIAISGGTGDNLNSSTDGGDPKPFDGTIGEAGNTTTVKALEISSDVKDATITLNNIAVSGGDKADDNKTEVKAGAEVTIKLEGENTLGTLTVEGGASLILQPEAGAKVTVTEIANAGTFIDSTATITQVTGTGALGIQADIDGGGEVKQDANITLTAATNDKGGTTFFIWQQKNADGSYTDMLTNEYDSNGNPVTRANPPAGITDNYVPPTSTTGTFEYRCLIKREVTPGSGSGSSTATTLLRTKSETVKVTPKSNPDPDPDPAPDPSPTVYYDITLPSVEGAVTDPAAGTYEVESWGTFSFSLTLAKDYDQSKPVVTTSEGETITPRASDGKYLIKQVRSDLSVSITGIVKNNPTANEEITAASPRVWGSRGYLHVSLPIAAKATIYTFGGALLKSARLPAGDTQVAVPAGSYIVVAGDSSFKVIIK